MACAVVTNKQYEKFKKYLQKNDINIKGLTKQDLMTGLSKLINDNVLSSEFNDDDVLSNVFTITEQINKWKLEAQEKNAKSKNTVQKSGKIGNATIKINTSPKKTDPQNNKNSVFVTEYSAQAYNRYYFPDTFDGVIESKDDIKLYTDSGTLMQLTDTNGDLNNNAYAFVTRKNAQSKDGKWISKKDDKEISKMVFQDSDFDTFVAANTEVAKNIINATKKEDAKEIYLPQQIGVDIENNKEIAYLPEKFADALIKIIQEIFGIPVQKVRPDVNKDLFYLELQINNGENTKGEKQGEKKESKKDREAREAKESLNAKRPVNISVDTTKIQNDVLKRQFPNIRDRKAKVNLIAELFTRRLDDWVNAYSDELKSKSKEGKRKEVLLETDADNNPVAYSILNDIKNLFDAIADYMLDGKISENAIAAFIDEWYKKNDSIFGEEYAMESAVHDVSDNELHERAKKLIIFANKIRSIDGLFEGLVNAASDVLAVNENINLSIDKSKPVNTQEDSDEVQKEDESAEIKSDFYLVKQKFVDPKSTLTYGIKSRLGRLYKADSVSVDAKGNRTPNYIYDEFGLRVRMDSGVAYYSILKKAAPMLMIMEDYSEFEDILKNLEDEYPWFIDMANDIRNDKDLRSQFFRGFCKSLVIYTEITPNARLQYKNLGMDAGALLDVISKNYEGNNILSETSLYNVDGKIDMGNVEYFRKLIFADKKIKKMDELAEKHPLAFVMSVLAPEGYRLNVDDAKKAYKILKGEYIYENGQRNEHTSIKNILDSIGIDTSDMTFDVLLPNINWDNIDNLKDLDNAWSKSSRDKLCNVVLALFKLVHKEYGLKINSNLLNSHRNTLLMIANSISKIAENYTQASFFYNGNSRYAYISPDFISRFENIIREGNEEKIEKFLKENYLDIDFFKNSPLLNELLKSEDARKQFRRIEVLDVNTGKKGQNTTIGKVSDKNFLTGLIYAFFKGSVKDGRAYCWVRNPLFSDKEVLNLFKVPMETDNEIIINNILTVAEAELDRIIDNKAHEGEEKIKIDNFNTGKNNASKFNFLPFLNNSYVVETIRKNRRTKSSPMSLAEAKKYIEEQKKINPNETSIIENEIVSEYKEKRIIPRDLIRQKIKEELERGYADFLNYLDELKIDKKSLLNKLEQSIKENESEDNKEEEDDGSIFDGTTILFTDDEDENDEEEDGEEEKSEKLDNNDQDLLDYYLKRFYYNDYYLQSQLIMILGGDLADYKNARDFIKRNAQSYASGEKIWPFNSDGTPMVERVTYLEDKVVISNSFQHIKELLEQSSLTKFEKEVMIGSLDALSKITSTDGFGLRTQKSFKKIFESMGGMWNEDIESAFQDIMSGNINVQSFVALVNQIKPFLFSHEVKMVNGRLKKIQVQHKNSEYLLSALFTSLNTALNKSPELKALQRFAELHDIDCFQFKSAVKEGCFSPLNLNYARAYYNGKGTLDSFLEEQKKALIDGKISQDEYNNILAKYSFAESTEADTNKLIDIINKYKNGELSSDKYVKELKEYQSKHPKDALVALELQMMDLTEENSVHTIPIKDLIIAQPSSDHLTDSKGIWGSQSKNIIPADLSPDFETRMVFGGTHIKFNRTTIRNMFDTLLTDQILDANDKLDRDFKDVQKTKDRLESAMEGNPKYSGEIRRAFELNESKTGFKLPMNNPIMGNKGEELLLSQFENNIQTMHINGGNAPIISNFALSHGMHDELYVHYKTVKDKNGAEHKVVDYIPCYLPAYYSKMYKDFIIEETDEHGNTMMYLDTKKMIENGVSEELFKIIGYRIPTEDKYSILPLKIVGFLPIQAGGSIMLPSDIVALTGGDFDIDKLFIMRKAFRREVASRELGLEFIQWLEQKEKKPNEKYIKRLVNVIKDEKTGKVSYSARYKGFTTEELLHLIDDYEDFKTFFNEAQRYYEHPKYTVLQPKLKFDDKGNIDVKATSLMADVKSQEMRKALRDNMVIDIYYGILTSIEGSKMLMTPASYEFEKAGSRQQIIENNPILLKAFTEKYKKEIEKYGSVYETLNNFGTITRGKNDPANLREALDEFLDEYSVLDDPCNIRFYVQTHRNLMDGNGLIGGLAVNSSRHYKFQLFEDENGNSGLTLDEKHMFKIKIPGYGEFTINQIDSRLSPITGKPIGKTNSGLQSASPDNGKDPCLGDLGINMFTLPQTNFMSAIGFESNLIGELNRCYPLIKEGYRLLGKKDSSTRRQFEKTFKLIDFVMDVEKLNKLHEKYILSGSKFDVLSADEEKFLKSLALWWNNIKVCSSDLNDLSVFVRADSPNGALAVTSTDAMVQLLKIEKLKRRIKNGEISIKGLDKLIDLDLTMGDMSRDEFREKILSKPIPRMQAYLTCGITNAVNLVRNYVPELSRPMLDTILKLEHITGRDFTKKKNLYFLRTFMNEFTKYAISAAEFLNSTDLVGERNFYIHDFVMKFKEFMDAKDSKKKYKNAEVRNMPLFKMITNESKKGIKFKNVGGKTSRDSRQDYTDSLDKMLIMNDETQQFAIDTFKYAYYDHGLSFGPSNYGIFYSINFMEILDGFIDSLIEGNHRLTSNDTVFLENYLIEYLLNNPKLIAKGPSIDNENVKEEEDINRLTINLEDLEESQKNKVLLLNPGTGYMEPRKLLRYSHTDKDTGKSVIYVYRLIKDDLQKAEYEKIDYNSSGVSFYDCNTSPDAIQWDSLKNRGVVISVKNLNNKSNKEEKEPSSAPFDSKELNFEAYNGWVSTTTGPNMVAPTEGQRETSDNIDEQLNKNSAPKDDNNNPSVEPKDRDFSSYNSEPEVEPRNNNDEDLLSSQFGVEKEQSESEMVAPRNLSYETQNLTETKSTEDNLTETKDTEETCRNKKEPDFSKKI